MTAADPARADSPRALRIGAYVLAGDPVWLTSSLARYYPLLSDLVVVAPRSRLGWTGRPLPVDECLRLIAAVDSRGISTTRWGEWQDPADPMRADTAQRQAGIDALAGRVDWILQIDNDEILPNPQRLIDVLALPESQSVGAIEWPMRVLYRRLKGGRYLEISSRTGRPRYDYPGPIAVRPDSLVVEARRTNGTKIRAVVRGDTQSLQLAQPLAEDEIRLEVLEHADAIVHNSWARDTIDVRRKIRTWGHAAGLRGEVYYWTKWWPAPVTWRVLRDFHPFSRGLWPRLQERAGIERLLVPPDR